MLRLIVASSFTASVSFTAVIGSLTPVIVIVSVAVSVSVPSDTVYVKVSVTVSPGSRGSAASLFAV